jgi:TRAP-type uncharacterized transport system fused permease subunit
MFERLRWVERRIFDALALTLMIFYSYSAVLEPAATQYHRGVYVLITSILVFLVYPTQGLGAAGRVLDYLLIVASIVCIGYWMLNLEAINYRAGIETPLDKWIAAA